MEMIYVIGLKIKRHILGNRWRYCRYEAYSRAACGTVDRKVADIVCQTHPGVVY